MRSHSGYWRSFTDSRGGTSFWLVDLRGDEDIGRLVAALVATPETKRLETLTLRFVGIERVRELGIDVAERRGVSLMKDFNPDEGL